MGQEKGMRERRVRARGGSGTIKSVTEGEGEKCESEIRGRKE